MNPEGLFRPDSRTLGGSPAGDLSLYGALPLPAFLAPPTQDLSFAARASEAAGATPSPATTALVRPATAADHDGSPHHGAPPAAVSLPLLASVAHAAHAVTDAGSPSAGSLLPTGFSAADHGLVAPLVSLTAQPDDFAAPAPTEPLPQAELALFSLGAPTLASAPDAAPVEIVQIAAAAPAVAADAADAVLQIAPALGGVGDDVQDLLGADPAGGIATLVSLVSVTDVLDLGQAGSGVPAADPALAMLDTLSADLLPPDAAGDAPIPLPEPHDEPAPAPLPGVPDPLHDLPGAGDGGLGLGL